MHTSLTKWCRSGLTVLFRHSVGTYLGNELTRKSPGNIWPQSSQLAETLWTDPGLKNGIVVRELIFNQKKKKKSKRRRGANRRTFPQSPRIQGKKHTKNTNTNTTTTVLDAPWLLLFAADTSTPAAPNKSLPTA